MSETPKYGSEPTASTPPTADRSLTTAAPTGQPMAKAARSYRGFSIALISVAAICGLASWGIGEGALIGLEPSFQMDEETQGAIETSTAEVKRQMFEAELWTAVISYTALGGLLGLGLGLLGSVYGIPRAGRWVFGPLIGLFVGALGGGTATYFLALMFQKALQANPQAYANDLLGGILIHCGMWMAAGVAGSLALSIGLLGWKRAPLAAIGGILGVIFGTFLYDILGGILFATAQTSHPYAHGNADSQDFWARMLAHLSITLFVALGTLWMLRDALRDKMSDSTFETG